MLCLGANIKRKNVLLSNVTFICSDPRIMVYISQAAAFNSQHQVNVSLRCKFFHFNIRATKRPVFDVETITLRAVEYWPCYDTKVAPKRIKAATWHRREQRSRVGLWSSSQWGYNFNSLLCCYFILKDLEGVAIFTFLLRSHYASNDLIGVTTLTLYRDTGSPLMTLLGLQHLL